MKSAYKNLMCLFIFLLLPFFVRSQEFKKYEYKSGKLEQKITGNVTGTNIVYWDDFGNKELTVLDISFFGNSQKQTILSVGEDIYTWKDKDTVINHASNEVMGKFIEHHFTPDDFARLSSKLMEKSGFVQKGTDTLMDKVCIIWENQQGGKIWAWKNLTLQMEMNMGGMSMKYEPVSLSLDTKLPENTFKLPDFKIIDQNTGTNEAEKQMMLEIINEMFESSGK